MTGSSLWLGFVLAQLLFSGWWWLWLVAGAVPPLAFVVVPILMFIAFGAAVWRGVPVPRVARWLVVGPVTLALVLGAGLSGLNPNALVNDPAQAPDGAVKVMSWNTHRTDRAEFPGFLRAQNADVYLLQEYAHVDELRQKFPEYTVVARGELVTLSRFPVVGQSPAGSDRVQRTDVNVRGRILSIYNTHIPMPFNTETSPLAPSFYRHIRGAADDRRAQLDGLVADVTSNRGPVVVAGDFSTSPSMGDLDGLRDVADDAVSASTSWYPTSWLAWRLDWAFTRDVRVHAYEFTDPRELSDHRPQWLVISMQVPD